MLPLLALFAPAAAATVLETIGLATGTAIVTTVAIRATNDVYDAATKKEKEDDEG
jgi:hypothetical protein